MKELKEFLRNIKLLAGIFILSLAIAFPLIMLIDDMKSAFIVLYITGGLFLLVFLLMAYIQIITRKLRNGPLVIGTVVSAKETMENQQHLLNLTMQFYTLDGRQVTASSSMDFPKGLGKAFQPGEPHPLRYHPEKPEEILIGMEGVDDAALEAAFDRYSETVKNGPQVMGRIVSIKNHIVRLNKNSILNITVQFNTTNGQQVTASDRRKVADDDIEQFMLFRPEELVALRYARENPQQVMLEPHAMKKTLDYERALRREKVKNGPLVFGMVVLEEPTGWQRGDMEIVDISIYFKTIDGQAITAHTRVAQKESQLNSLAPLRYDPNHPQQISLANDEDEATLQAALDAQRVASGHVSQEEVDMLRNGVKATGLILSAQPTGNIVDGDGEMALHLKVTRPEGGTYEVRIHKVVPQDALASTQPGRELEVFYMPKNEENIAVVL